MRSLLLLALAGLLAWLGLDLAAGNRAYRRGDVARAAAEYRQALARGDGSALVRYNLGTARLRLGEHAAARPHLRAVPPDAPAPLRQRAQYNLGNTGLEPAWRALVDTAAGAVRRPATPAEREALQRAVAAYQAALRLAPQDTAAKWNLELALWLLREAPQGGGGGGGGGGGDAEAPASPGDAQPQPRGPGSDAPLTPAEAEQLLSAAERTEADVQRALLRQQQRRPPSVRDW